MTKVYEDFDQETLDNEYLISRTVPSIEPFISDYGKFSAEARAKIDCRKNVSCGDHPDQLIDIFPAKGKDGGPAPVFVFIHGGYWRMLSHRESSFMAENMVANGIAVIAVNYSLTPEASIDTIVHQCRDAIAWTWRNASGFGADPDRIFVCGSSAGGHLTGMMVAGGWHDAFGVPADVIKGAVPLSGLHDLEPLRLSCINEWAMLDAAAARRNSPVHHPPDAGCPLILSYGASETSEFKRQSALLADAWRARGWQADIFEHPDRNHFDIVFDLRDFDTLLGRKVRDMIG
jgi:arylformamidase